MKKEKKISSGDHNTVIWENQEIPEVQEESGDLSFPGPAALPVPAAKKIKRRYRTKARNASENLDRAFLLLGDVAGLVEWARRSDDNLTEFYKLYGKKINKDLDTAAPGSRAKYKFTPEHEAELRKYKDKVIQLRLIEIKTKESSTSSLESCTKMVEENLKEGG